MSPLPPSFNSNSVCIRTRSRYSLPTIDHPPFDALLFSCTYKSLFHPDRFAGPLFPHTYKSLSPQLLSFHIYTKPRGCRDYAPSSTPRSAGLSVEKSPNSFPDIPLRTLEISLLSFATSRPLFSIVCGLFLKAKRVWGKKVTSRSSTALATSALALSRRGSID